MSELYLMRQGKSLVAYQDSDGEVLQKLKHGTIYKAEVTAPRNLKRHRRFFALLNLTYDYWSPESMVAEVEKETVARLQGYLIKHGLSADAVSALCTGFISDLEKHRAETNTGKCFESFRAWITVKAGYYQIVQTPAGPRKTPKSISFSQCDDCDFNNFYKQVLNACWDLCLHKIYANQEDLAEQLLRFE